MNIIKQYKGDNHRCREDISADTLAEDPSIGKNSSQDSGKIAHIVVRVADTETRKRVVYHFGKDFPHIGVSHEYEDISKSCLVYSDDSSLLFLEDISHVRLILPARPEPCDLIISKIVGVLSIMKLSDPA